MMLKALDFAVETIKDFPDANNEEITDKFATKCRETVSELANTTNEAFIINSDITKRAKLLVDYFNMNKLILSSYCINPNGTFDDAFKKIVNNKPTIFVTSVRFAHLPALITRYCEELSKFPF